MRNRTRLAALGATAVAGLAAAAPAQAEPLIGLTNANSLVLFDSATPQTGTEVAISGLGDQQVLGIDVRPASGELYALTSGSRLHRVNPATGAATAVGTGAFAPLLDGSAFGFDFNPTVDRIRIVSDAEQNLRVNPDNGAVAFVDGLLSYGMGGPDPDVTGAGYTNSVPGATTTTLYDVDVAQDQLVAQRPPNAGTLVPVGPLGQDVAGDVGFEISPRTGVAYLTDGGTLYTVDLASGTATPAGTTGIELIGLASAPVCTITGTDGPDTLRGTVGDDVICGLLGNDIIDGVGGTDIILGGGGNDRLTGGAGTDRLEGADGNDRLAGSGGGDVIVGAGGADLVYGGSGNDVLRGAEGDDVVAGEAGNDMADGGAGADNVTGADGEDMLAGGAGSDRIVGSNGDDAIVSNEAVLPAPTPPNAPDDVQCGAGTDSVDADDSDALTACE